MFHLLVTHIPQCRPSAELGFAIRATPSTAPISASPAHILQQLRCAGRAELVDSAAKRPRRRPVEVGQADHGPMPTQQLQESGLVETVGRHTNLLSQFMHAEDRIWRLRHREG